MRSRQNINRVLLLLFIMSGPVSAATVSQSPTSDLAKRLSAIQTSLPNFKSKLDTLKRQGQDISYPLVTYTVLDNSTRDALQELTIIAPSGWGMLGVNGADANAILIADPHNGHWAIKISNCTPHHPNVYGMFQYESVISLKAGQPYTLSIWAKTNKPGVTSIPLNASWSNRLEIAGTSGNWRRFSKTFTPSSADTAFQPRILSEDVGDPVIVDDVCLVPGDQAEHGENLIPNPSFELFWNQERVGREIGDMEAMARRLGAELAEANAGHLHWPIVPRWDGTARPSIQGPSFIGPVRLAANVTQRPIFFVGYGHFGQVQRDIEKFPAYGINIIQDATLGPSAIYPSERKIDEKAIDDFSAELDRAAKAGVAVDWLLSPHVVAEWWLAKYPGLRTGRADFFPYSIYSPHVRPMLTDFAHRVVAKIKDKPALLSICLSNEPINCQSPDANSTAAWRAWLESHHGDITTLNARWGTKYASFDQIPQPSPLANSGEPRPGGAWCDFCRWNDEYFTAFHKMMADAVHDVAPQIPVHIKATTWHYYRASEAHSGDDATLFGGITQINGNDSVNLWSFGDRSGDSIERGNRDFALGWRENALSYELQRSVHNAPVFNSENHLIFDRELRYISPDHIRAALWMGAIHGQSATTLWVWERELSNPQSDFAGDIMERPSCADAVGTVCLDLNRVAPQITALQNAPADVLILQSETAAVWDGSRYGDALLKLFTALSYTGLKPGFLTERLLEQNGVSDAPLLIVPDVVHLSDSAFTALGSFKGKVLFASSTGSELLTRNDYDQARSMRLDPSHLQSPLRLPAKWQDLVPLLQPRLQEAGIDSAVKFVDQDGKPQTQVQWQTARAPQGLVINLYNASHDPATVKPTQPMAMMNLLTGERLQAGASIALKSLEARLMVAE